MSEKFAHYRNLFIDGDSEYVIAIYACLMELSRLGSGKAFLKDLDDAGREIVFRKPERGNKCQPVDRYAAQTRFANAIDGKIPFDFLVELTKAVHHGLIVRGMSARFLKEQLFKGLSPIDRMSVFSNVSPERQAEKSKENLENWKKQDDKGAFRNAYTLLAAIIDDPEGFQVIRTMNDRSGATAVADLLGHETLLSDLQRLLRPSFEDEMTCRGPGSACVVYFDPLKPSEAFHRNTSVPPVDSVNRPPVIGLAHELVHTLRAVYGLLTTCDRIEEGLAVGLPPFNFEKYSENLFRLQYNKQFGGKLPMRYFYESYVKPDDKGYGSALKAYIEHLRRSSPEAAKDFAGQCKKSFDRAARLKLKGYAELSAIVAPFAR